MRRRPGVQIVVLIGFMVCEGELALAKVEFEALIGNHTMKPRRIPRVRHHRFQCRSPCATMFDFVLEDGLLRLRNLKKLSQQERFETNLRF